MVITELNGGLGNQMFQYAIGRSLALKLNTNLQLDVTSFENYKLRRYELDVFNIVAGKADPNNFSFIKDNCRLYKLRQLWQKLRGKPVGYRERSFSFSKEVLNLTGNIYLQGYWQSEKYFNSITDIIRNDFSLKNSLQKNNQEWADKIKNTVNPVSVHVRHGDYVANPITNEVHGTCSLEYYNKCVEYILRNISRTISVFVFSDDISWTKKNFHWNVPVFFIDGNGEQFAYEEMRLMSLCKYHIIANSSFSWWGAWLDEKPEKRVLAPKKWFNNGPRDMQDLLPEEWLKF